jgi:hypothetical protein
MGALKLKKKCLVDISAKRKAPPKAEKLVDHHLKTVKDAVAKHPGHPLVLMGKSLGSRYYFKFCVNQVFIFLEPKARFCFIFFHEKLRCSYS